VKAAAVVVVGRRGGRRRRRGHGGAEGEAMNTKRRLRTRTTPTAADVTAQHRSQPEFDFDDEAAPAVSVAAPAQPVSRPAPSQPAEAAAAPAQAAAHDASFAHTPIEHDVDTRVPGAGNERRIRFGR
jgi:ribonuclease E